MADQQEVNFDVSQEPAPQPVRVVVPPPPVPFQGPYIIPNQGRSNFGLYLMMAVLVFIVILVIYRIMNSPSGKVDTQRGSKLEVYKTSYEPWDNFWKWNRDNMIEITSEPSPGNDRPLVVNNGQKWYFSKVIT